MIIISTLGWFDIAFNFLIGDDGVVYKGRGCNWEGSTAKGLIYEEMIFIYKASI